MTPQIMLRPPPPRHGGHGVHLAEKVTGKHFLVLAGAVHLGDEGLELRSELAHVGVRLLDVPLEVVHREHLSLFDVEVVECVGDAALLQFIVDVTQAALDVVAAPHLARVIALEGGGVLVEVLEHHHAELAQLGHRLVGRFTLHVQADKAHVLRAPQAAGGLLCPRRTVANRHEDVGSTTDGVFFRGVAVFLTHSRQ
jgi:hypothetical protein